MDMYLITIGTVKVKALRELIDDYKDRITNYLNFHLIELNEENRLSDKENMAKEAEYIKKVLPNDSYIVSLAIEGKKYTSPGFADFIERHYAYDARPLVFIIGGSAGIDSSIKSMSQSLISFSDMTFPHQLMRLIALEQIYRAETIIHHQKYHK